MKQPGPVYLAVIRGIDALTRWSAYLFAFLLVPLVLSNTIEAEVWDEGLAIDGRMITYDQFRELLTAREGRTVTIQIKDGTE